MMKSSLTVLSCLAILFSAQASLSSEEERVLSAIARIQEDDEFRSSRRRTQKRSPRSSKERGRNNTQSKAESPIPKITATTSSHTLRRHINPSQPSAPKAASTATLPWVSKFLNERSKDVLVPVPRDYIADGFNLAQLAPIVERIGFQVLGDRAIILAKELVQFSNHSYPIYRLALQLILNETDDENSILLHPLIPAQAIQEAAQALYLMIHARYVSSPRGLEAIRRIVVHGNGMFGRCPRASCQGSVLLPWGHSIDYTGFGQKCMRYCPTCGEYWNFWDSKTDGCAWGPSLCHLFLMSHGPEIYAPTKTISAENTDRFKVMGFRIHPAAMFGKPLNKY